MTQEGEIQTILKSRLDHALSIYESTDMFLVCGKYSPKILVPMRCEHTTEAEAMKQYLLAYGIPIENIIKEEQSETTFGNALFSYLNILKETAKNYSSIIIVSNEFHEPLVKYCFNKVFGNNIPYIFSKVPDAILDVAPNEIRVWKNIIKKLINECYPMLFANIENGNINAIKAVIASPDHGSFDSAIRKLLHIDDSATIVIAGEDEGVGCVDNITMY